MLLAGNTQLDSQIEQNRISTVSTYLYRRFLDVHCSFWKDEDYGLNWIEGCGDNGVGEAAQD